MATTNSVKQHKLRKRLTNISSQEGRGKEFLSLYIPDGKSIDEVVADVKVESDLAASKYEDTKDVRNRLQEAFKNVIQRLKLQKEIPQNGLALFAGVFITGDLESEVLNVEEIIPPEPIITYHYEVDDHFRLEPLREMIRNQKVVGLLALDSKEASFGILNG